MSRPRAPADKLIDRDELIERFGRPRAGTLVFTNGCFDVLHRGHVDYLNAARALGDLLVVAVNSDASVGRLKGDGRPINVLEDRALVLAALECVDIVTPFGEDTPRALIAALLPDVLVKGGDYAPEAVVGRAEVEDAGGRVVIVPLVPGRSTTATIARMKELEQ
jgi:D-beta-D-heptose 7-phosphate kinase/D-beta-D-heptose 1-phosphate adenosyltransferase